MRKLTVHWRRMLAIVRRRRLERDLEDELAFHLAMREQEQREAGASPTEADMAARRRFGSAAVARDLARDAWLFPWLESLQQDVRFAVRAFRRTPGFTIVAVLTLALAIGANTAVYSVVDRAILGALPLGDPDRLVLIWEEMSDAGFPTNTPAPANYFDWKARSRSFVDMAATRGVSGTASGGGPPELLNGRRVTFNFFQVLGIQPALGRTFTEDEDRSGAPVVVISHGVWQRRFGGSLDALGAPLVLGGRTFTVVGVMAPRFFFRSPDIDFWTPVAFTAELAAVRQSHFLNVVARRRPDVSLDRTRDEMREIAAALAAEYPATNDRVGAVVVPVRDDLLGGARVALLALQGAAACVLLMACANLAGLLFARAGTRRSELAIRAAIGATRARVARQLIIEAVVLVTGGAALGLLLAPAGAFLLSALVPAALAGVESAPLDLRVLAGACALTAATSLACGLAPALLITRGGRHETLPDSRTRTGAASTAARDILVIAQVAAAVLLLVGAGLMLRTLANLYGADVGFQPDRLLTLRTALPADRYNSAPARLRFYASVLDGLRGLPGVERAAFASTLPFMSLGNTIGYGIDGRSLPPGDPGDAMFRSGTEAYLAVLGARLVEGRLLEARDAGGSAPPVVVVNRTFARLYWPGQSALGRRVIFGRDTPWRTIVGVVDDVRERSYEFDAKPAAYVLYDEALGNAWIPERLVVRTAADPLLLLDSVRQVIADADPAVPIAVVGAMNDVIDASLAERRAQTSLLAVFSGLALLLASLGVYGVLSYTAARRRREIALRLALGATGAAVLRTIARRGVVLVVIGLAAGSAAAWAASRVIQSLLYETRATDPGTFAAAISLVALVSALACVVPALRALRCDPASVLRGE